MQEEPYPRVCLTCGEPLVQRPKEKLYRFRRRRFCSRRCGTITPCRGCGERKPKAAAATNQHGRGLAGFCESCYRARLKVPHYGSGRSASLTGGYIRIWEPDHPLAQADGYVYEHRKVLWDAGIDPRGKVVHHLNGDRTDNRLENLEALTQEQHSGHHVRERGYVVNQYGIWPLKNAA